MLILEQMCLHLARGYSVDTGLYCSVKCWSTENRLHASSSSCMISLLVDDTAPVIEGINKGAQTGFVTWLMTYANYTS